MLDYLIRGGTIVDGTGSKSYVADVGIRAGRIVEDDGAIDVGTVLDASGLLVTPGFIDPARTTTRSCIGTAGRHLRVCTVSLRTSHDRRFGAPCRPAGPRSDRTWLAGRPTFSKDWRRDPNSR
jgi:hypothetical protein